jgi:hypothetical protein
MLAAHVLVPRSTALTTSALPGAPQVPVRPASAGAVRSGAAMLLRRTADRLAAEPAHAAAR